MHFLSQKIEFPKLSEASPEGLLAIGGDLNPERLLHAYSLGIFPWFEEEQPILWWSPDPRFVIFPEELKVSKSMERLFRKQPFTVTTNKDFESVISNCSNVYRKGQKGTWITDTMIKSYTELHKLGYATSVEVWENKQLVGGLYGVDLGVGVFCGESMFTKVSNASKYGFIHFIRHSKYKLIDCQLHTNHLESLGGKYMSRNDFIQFL